jgi:Fur family ferric uptake transcriptional regulator
MTPQRRVILEELGETAEHPTADQLYERVRRRLPRISLGTVYRNLDLLADRGLIGKIEVGPGPRRFDARAERHHHVVCLGCGRIADVPPGVLEAAEPDLCDVEGFKVVGCRVELLGYCPECRTGRGGGD